MTEEGSSENLITSSGDDGSAPTSETESLGTERWTLTPSMRLCVSHLFSAWGDRMWRFVIGLILVELTPNSLRLTATYGLTMALSQVFFGPTIGSLVDAYPRLKVATVTLVSQNGFVVICAGFLLTLLQMHNLSESVSGLLRALVILSAAMANLASLGNKVAIEKDWVVVIAGDDKVLLAGTNAKMRRIDLCCMILAPMAVGQIMTYISQTSSVIVVAVWNVVSVFLEYYLIWNVYKHTPALAVKRGERSRHSGGRGKADYIPAISTSKEDVTVEEGEGDEILEDESGLIPQVGFESTNQSPLKRLYDNVLKFKTGWNIYMRQPVARGGIALACLYLTVLGFSAITQGYAYTQGLTESILSICYGLGALSGVAGTFLFPQLHKRIGLVRTGLVSMTAQFSCLLFCLISIIAPGSPGIHLFGTQAVHKGMSSGPTAKPSHNPLSNPSVSIMTESVLQSPFIIQSSALYSYNSNKSQALVFPSATQSMPSNLSTTQSMPSNLSTTQPMPSNLTVVSSQPTVHQSPTMIHPSPTQFIPRPTSSASSGTNETTQHPPLPVHRSLISISLFMFGLITSRLGLYMSDLVISQLTQECVPEQERGIVGGMQTTFNSVMDFLHFILAIIFPYPEEFGLLVIISVMMVGMAGILYASLSYKLRGHLFHLQRVTKWCAKENANSPSHLDGSQSDLFQEEDSSAEISSIRNENFESEQLL